MARYVDIHKDEKGLRARKITYYQSPIGMPYATMGNMIAGYGGFINNKDFYFITTVKRFEREKFPISKMRLIEHGMPPKYKDALKKRLTDSLRKGF